MIRCPNCRTTLGTNATVCTECGRKLFLERQGVSVFMAEGERQPKEKKRRLPVPVGVAVICLVLFLGLGAGLGWFTSQNVQGARMASSQLDNGKALLAAGKTDQAIIAFEKAASADESNLEAQCLLIQAYNAAGDFGGADTVVARLKENGQWNKLGEAQFSVLINSYREAGQTQTASALLAEALEVCPGSQALAALQGSQTVTVDQAATASAPVSR